MSQNPEMPLQTLSDDVFSQKISMIKQRNRMLYAACRATTPQLPMPRSPRLYITRYEYLTFDEVGIHAMSSRPSKLGNPRFNRPRSFQDKTRPKCVLTLDELTDILVKDCHSSAKRAVRYSARLDVALRWIEARIAGITKQRNDMLLAQEPLRFRLEAEHAIHKRT